jgi:mono/diheme cytochrome c family protein
MRLPRPLFSVARPILAAVLLLLAHGQVTAEQGATDPPAGGADPVARGAYLFAAAGCAGCHTDVAAKGPPLGGGRALKTPFGTFYGPNITADPTYGIGRWSDADFLRALHEGEAPDGSNLYPVFPYPSFTKMTDADALAIKAYIWSLPPVAKPSRPHDLSFPYGWRFTLTPWKWLNFTAGRFVPRPDRDAGWNRGAYLVQALGHCGECHTPRGWLGGTQTDQALSGNPDGPDGDKVPNLTSDPATGLGGWSPQQIVAVLKSGLLPDGDVVGGGMAEVVRQGTSQLTDDDRMAIASYLKSLPPIANPKAKATSAGFD